MATCPQCRRGFADERGICPDDGEALLPDDMFAALDDALAPGTLVGEYRVERKIGSGGFGDVYAAEHPMIGKRGAIKVLHRKFSAVSGMVARFIAEARAVNKIRHRNIIDIFAFGRLHRGQHYFIMELLEGHTLKDLLRHHGTLTLERAYPILEGVAAGLDAAHAAGIAHRDLKPDNIFVATEKDGVVIPRLLDFGIAKLMGDDAKHHTGTGTVMGTPVYMSPEQCRGRNVDPRSDVYSLGIVLFEVLSGKVPFDGEASVDILNQHLYAEPPRLSRSAPDVPPEIDAPMAAMLAKRPEDRPSSAGVALAAVLAAARAGGRCLDVVAAQRMDLGPRDPTPRELRAEAATVELGAATARSPAPDVDVTRPSGREPGEVHAPGTVAGASENPRRTELTLETDNARRVRGRPLRVGFVAGLSAAFVAVMWFLGRKASPPPSPDVTSERAPPAVATSSPVEPPVRAPPSEPVVSAQPLGSGSAVMPSPPPVLVRVSGLPSGAEIWSQSERVTPGSDGLSFPRGTDPIELTFKKSGFVDERATVVPDRDQSLKITLRPVAAPRGNGARPSAKPTSGVDRLLIERD